ncbi:HTH domain-containing protein [Haloarcula marina]|uniref:HTH domain-containing protein n=1 Tax=Haloarcula marina TaxID=2961574 RepID=UPI0020B9003E|nr:HTH domain-containing protein [Halomicroarcula marina]
MATTECPTTRRAELFVRSDLPQASEKCLDAVEVGLEKLARRGVLDDYERTEWEKRIPISGDGHRPERERFNEFAEWANERGAYLAPFFDTRWCYSDETGERRKELVLPVLCLAVYEDGELARVAPFAEDGTPTSLGACLAELATETAMDAGTATPTTAD